MLSGNQQVHTVMGVIMDMTMHLSLCWLVSAIFCACLHTGHHSRLLAAIELSMHALCLKFIWFCVACRLCSLPMDLPSNRMRLLGSSTTLRSTTLWLVSLLLFKCFAPLYRSPEERGRPLSSPSEPWIRQYLSTTLVAQVSLKLAVFPFRCSKRINPLHLWYSYGWFSRIRHEAYIFLEYSQLKRLAWVSHCKTARPLSTPVLKPFK